MVVSSNSKQQAKPRVVAGVRAGLSLEQSARRATVSAGTVARWRKRDRGFDQQIAAAAQHSKGVLVESTRSLILAQLYGASAGPCGDAADDAARSETVADADDTERSGGPETAVGARGVGFAALEEMVHAEAGRALPAGQVEKDLVDLCNDGFVDVSPGRRCKLTPIGMVAGERLARLARPGQ